MTAHARPAHLVLTTLLASATLGLAPALDAQTTEQLKLLPGDGAAGDTFGAAVATDGARIAVGAPGAGSSGSAYVFDAATGLEQLELAPAGAAAGDRFGASIAVDGSRVVVGAPQVDGVGADSGAAYVFDAVSGAELLTLTPSDASAGAQFGYSVAIDGGLVVVGSPSSAYLFDASTGQQLEQFIPSVPGGGFGESVDIDGGRVVVGARLQNGVSGFSGAAYLFDAASGDQLHRIVANNGTAWSFFGAAVSLDGDVLAIGAPEAYGGVGKHSGVAFVFDASSGSQEHDLWPAYSPLGGHVFSKFGSSIAVDGQDVFIGAEQNNVQAPGGFVASAGSVYHYDVTSGSPLAKLIASDAESGDDFGLEVAVAGGVLVSGAPRGDDLGGDSGAAYLYDLGSGWASLGAALAGTHGEPALAGGGDLGPLQPITLALTDALENSTAYFVVGVNELGAAFKGGTLVPDPVLVVALPTGVLGEIAIATTWPNLSSGFALYFQYWIVDPAGPVGFAASNALAGTTP